ncbi:MAG: CDP-alcohol phosphatidyltransferase family protein [Methylococcaceae bacterium]|nr:CDP-alcohol phosphatidyltransferase family protein [Methylococcaceae bacterium]
MRTLYDLKPRFQDLLRPRVRWLANQGVTPNQITWAAAGLSLLGGICLALQPTQRWPLLLIPLLLFIRMALNAVDGLLAREHDMRTPLGALLNELGDGFSDAALYLPLGLIPGVSGAAAAVFAVLALLSEVAGLAALQIGASRRYDGPMGKSDRAFAIGFIALLLGLGLDPGAWVTALLWGLSLLLVLTLVKRVRKALQEIGR